MPIPYNTSVLWPKLALSSHRTLLSPCEVDVFSDIEDIEISHHHLFYSISSRFSVLAWILAQETNIIADTKLYI